MIGRSYESNTTFVAFEPPVEVVDDIVLKIHVPYSKTTATLQINPNIQDYQESGDTKSAKVRQVMVTTPTDETVTVFFDLNGVKDHQVLIYGSSYEIALLSITPPDNKEPHILDFEFEVVKL